MAKLHTKPSSKKTKKYDIGFFETWNFKDVDSIDVSYHTVVGKEKIIESKEDRVLIVVDGLASNLDTKEVIRGGMVIELPASQSFHFQGQLKYYMVTAKN